MTKEHNSVPFIKVRVSDKPVPFLYDMGSQYTIITRKTYDSLPNKSSLSTFSSSGIGVDVHNFCSDDIVCLNISFNLKERRTHQVNNKPVLVSKEINSNIFGTKAENKI